MNPKSPTPVPYLPRDVDLLTVHCHAAVRVRADARRTPAWTDPDVRAVRRAIKTWLRHYAGLAPGLDYAVPVRDLLATLRRDDRVTTPRPLSSRTRSTPTPSRSSPNAATPSRPRPRTGRAGRAISLRHRPARPPLAAPTAQPQAPRTTEGGTPCTLRNGTLGRSRRTDQNSTTNDPWATLGGFGRRDGLGKARPLLCAAIPALIGCSLPCFGSGGSQVQILSSRPASSRNPLVHPFPPHPLRRWSTGPDPRRPP